MDKSLKGLNIEEIIQEIGLYMPILDTITCFKNDKTAEEFYEIADKMGTREIIQYMKNHEKEFDVKKFIFLNYLYIINTLSPSFNTFNLKSSKKMSNKRSYCFKVNDQLLVFKVNNRLSV